MVISVSNHFTEMSASVPSSRIAFSAVLTSLRSFSPFSFFTKGHAFSIVSNGSPANSSGKFAFLINSIEERRSITNASVRPKATSCSIPAS
ncbi:hypothetical protein P3TCK_22954 [Photobacterium profundum 3TCK]|uniref:Uncharacterized protein n=1 Tax=Photobacterium profundum 3TCK TaxID=314280 RepID=Q1YZM7_9GAMM|nr:hypothetical protein P3TCK_22954 [Photobacterium profundum 3TCK]